MLGQGTFGQVAKCWDAETNNYVAVKVIKNQPAFYQQAIMEVSLLSLVRYFNVHSSIYFCWMHGKIWLSTVTIISPAVKQEIWSWCFSWCHSNENTWVQWSRLGKPSEWSSHTGRPTWEDSNFFKRDWWFNWQNSGWHGRNCDDRWEEQKSCCLPWSWACDLRVRDGTFFESASLHIFSPLS